MLILCHLISTRLDFEPYPQHTGLLRLDALVQPVLPSFLLCSLRSLAAHFPVVIPTARDYCGGSDKLTERKQEQPDLRTYGATGSVTQLSTDPMVVS